MAEFNPNPFKGEASIPHVPEEVFNGIWLGWQVSLVMAMIPGKLFGLHYQHNRINRDYAMSCSNEAAQALAARRGRVPTTAFHRPTMTDDSWPKMWAKHLHWKAWTLDRNGGGTGVRAV